MSVISLYSSDYRARFYLRQISKLAKIPLKTCQTTLLNLEKERIVKSKIEGKNKYFGLNMDNINVKSSLLKAEIYKTDIFLEKYPEFKTFLKSINSNTTIIIFGSFAKLIADKNSDLDLFIISAQQEKLPSHLLPYKIHQTRLKEDSFKKALLEKEALLQEINLHHVILNNHSSYINIMWGYYGK